jgi:hypothetical protein
MANTARKTETAEWPDETWSQRDAALFYGAKGWPVFPVRLDGIDKKPLIKDWPHAATTDRAQFGKWWREWPDAGIGMPCGKVSGLSVIDIDTKNDAPGKENAKALAKEHSGFTSGMWSRTPTGGIHRYFPWEELPFKSGAGKDQGGIAEGIDIRSQDIDGNGSGFVVLPPSCPPGGKPYEWGNTEEDANGVPDGIAYLACFTPKMREYIDATVGLKKRIMSLPREEWYSEYLINRSLRSGGVKLLKPGVIPKITGLTLDAPYCAKAIDEELDRLRNARKGEQNDTLTRVAAILGSLAAGLGLDPQSREVRELTDDLRDAALHMHSFDRSDPWDGRRGRSTIDGIIERQFFGWGFANPRDLSGIVATAGRKDQPDRGTDLAADDVEPDKSKAGQREVKLTWLDNVKPQPTEWLWPNRIVRGGLNAWSGDPGGGKSQLSCDVTARVTTGRPWPTEREDKPLRKPERVIILNAEDKTANDIVPRLMAAGADLSKVAVIGSVLKYDEKGNPVNGFLSLQTDIAELDKVLTELRDVALIIIDPISAYLGTVKSHNDAEVRGVLGPLSKLAEKHNVAVVYICHMNKGSDPKAIYRTQGSVAFVAAARSAFGVAIHSDDRDSNDPRRIFGPIKTNHAKRVPSLEFEIEPRDVHSNLSPILIKTSRVHWLGRSDMSVEDALNSGQRSETKREKARKWLREYLADGEALAKQIYKDGEKDGFNQRMLRRAAEDLGIDRDDKTDFQGSVPWRLP